MTRISENQSVEPQTIRAIEHLDADASVVKSGIALAEVVLRAMEAMRPIKVSFDGLKGASSSYFNVFLLRIQEGCGIAELEKNIVLEFGSNIQKMVFDRSYEAVKKGPRRPVAANNDEVDPVPSVPHRSFWKRLFGH